MVQPETIQSAVSLLKRHQRILIMPSAPPDGDSLGSALALYLILRKFGKDATVVCADNVPEVYRFFPNHEVISGEFQAVQDFIVTIDCSRVPVEHVHHEIQRNKVNIVVTPQQGQLTARDVTFSDGSFHYDLIVTVDTGDLEQLGPLYSGNVGFFQHVPLLNIDHHASNSQFGQVNFVDMTASSTTQAMMPIIDGLGENLIDEDIATLLLAGLITDTGSFQNPNTTPESLALAAKLVTLGARQQEIIKHVYKTKKLSTLKLWGKILSKIQADSKYNIVWSRIDEADLLETGANSEEAGSIIDELMTNAPNGEVFFLVKKKADGLYSFSIRTSRPDIDGSEIAALFGGGGHKQAAGCRIGAGSMEEAEAKFLEGVRNYQDARKDAHPPASATGDEVRTAQTRTAEEAHRDDRGAAREMPDTPRVPFPTPLDMEGKSMEPDGREQRIIQLGREFFAGPEKEPPADSDDDTPTADSNFEFGRY